MNTLFLWQIIVFLWISAYKTHMKTIFITLVALLSFCFAEAPIKQNINKYQAYLQQWKMRYPQLEVTQLQGFQQPGQMCHQTFCKFYYYTKRDASISESPDRNMTILLVGGLRGSDSISQKVLFQSYGVLKTYKIIYLPLANPSGFLKGSDIATPSQVKVQSDFPILGNNLCNQSVAIKILNHLFKTESIDLTIYVHDGAPSFNYGWSNTFLMTQFPQQDIGIQIDISQMVKYIGNLDSEDEELKTGPLVDIKGGADESIVDWIYGASKYPKIISQYCNGVKYTSDPGIKMNGLVFSLKVGVYNPQRPDKQTKNIRRAVQILNSLVQITNPKIVIKKLIGNQLSLSISGCKMGSLTNMKLFNLQKQAIYEKQTESLVKGNVMYGLPTPTILKIPSNINLPQEISYQIEYTCGDGWMMKGQTRFAQIKKYKQVGSIKNKSTKREEIITTEKIQTASSDLIQPEISSVQPNTPQIKQKEESKQELKQAALIALGLIAILWMGMGIKHTIHILKTQRIKNFSQKFQSIERAEDLQTMQSQNESSDSTSIPELIEMKPSSQDLDQQRLTTS